MTTNMLLASLKEVTQDAVKDLILPVALQEDDTEQQYRAPEVHLMRLPDSSSAKKKCPYIIHQVVKTSISQKPGDGVPLMRTVVRSIFAVYCRDEEEGALHLLNLMQRTQDELLRQVVIGKQFALDIQNSDLDGMIYPEDTAPYYIGEMSTTWVSRAMMREVVEYPHVEMDF